MEEVNMKKFLTGLFLILSAFSFSENVIKKISVTDNDRDRKSVV